MRKLILFISVIAIISGCKGKDSIESGPAPEKATLVSPFQNEVCLTGTSVSDLQSEVTLTWENAPNADSYQVYLKNLQSGVMNILYSAESSVEVPLKKNTPYSWYVITKSSKSSGTAQSETWKFFNSGTGKLSYAPFPAELISPTFGQNITAAGGKITLDWAGSDVDNDITAYTVYFGTTSTPELLRANMIESEVKDVAVTANTTYYWKIVTTDFEGNTTDSELFQFKVN